MPTRAIWLRALGRESNSFPEPLRVSDKARSLAFAVQWGRRRQAAASGVPVARNAWDGLLVGYNSIFGRCLA